MGGNGVKYLGRHTRNHRPGHGVHHIQYQAEIKPPISNSTRNKRDHIIMMPYDLRVFVHSNPPGSTTFISITYLSPHDTDQSIEVKQFIKLLSTA